MLRYARHDNLLTANFPVWEHVYCLLVKLLFLLIMKTLLASFVLIASSGLLACKKDDASKTATAIGQPFDLDDKQTTTLPTSTGSLLSVRISQINDSRCPSNAYCITAGYATVDVELTDATATPQLARIGLRVAVPPNYARDSVSVTLNQQKYWLRLLDVKPYPGGSSQTKTATLRLRPY